MITDLIQPQWVSLALAAMSIILCPILCWGMALNTYHTHHQS